MKFSIVIPTYNRASMLKGLLQSIKDLDYDKNEFETIIIDDGSMDETHKIIMEFNESLVIKYHKQSNSGPSSARNKGIELANGKFICFTDDDCILPKDWMKKINRFLKEQNNDGICGIAIDKTGLLFSSVSQFITNFLFRETNACFNQPVFVMSNNFVYRKEIFNKVEKFSLEFNRPGGEDREMNFRILKEGYKISFSNDLIIDHYHKLSFKSFIRQQFNYGRGSFILNKILKGLNLNKYQTPKIIYFKLVLEIFKNYSVPKNLVVLILFFLSQVVIVSGIVYKKYF